ncbi:MAG: helix-hairpin-helix domain-containing protein [Advenella sp.]
MKQVKTGKSCWLKWFLFLLFFLSGAANAVDLNSASREQLVSIKGIGLKTAENIISERQRGGPFLSRQDLSFRVKGIGRKRADKLFEAGLQIDGQDLPGRRAVEVTHQGRSTNKKGVKRSLSAAEPKLIKPYKENAGAREK